MKTKEFLTKNNIIAVVGVSVNSDKWGWKIYYQLKSAGFKVYPINPKHNKINNNICYSNLQALPKKPDVVITIVQPNITEQVVKECKKIGIHKVWMQPGSESKRSINFCKNNDINIITNSCFIIDTLK